MKKYFSISLLAFALLLAKPVHADILPEGQESIPVCAKFTNLSEFKDYYFLSVSMLEAANKADVKLLENNTCASGYYKFGENRILAVKKSDYPTKDFSSIKDFNDAHLISSGFSLPLDSKDVNSPTDLKKFEMEYKIASVSNLNVKIYKSADKIYYKNNGDSHVMEYDVTGKMTKETVPDRIFADIHGASNYADAILYLKDHSYINGYDDGTFLEQNPINRAEFAKIASNALKGTEFSLHCVEDNIPASDKFVYFSDVAKGLWYSDYVCAAKKGGIIKGFINGTFKPETTINFAEAYKIALTAKYGANKFNENTGKNWYDTYLDYVSSHNLNVHLANYPAERDTSISFPLPTPAPVDPSAPVSRGEMAGIMYLILTHTE